MLFCFWSDEDGELVTFSSDEELVEALGSIQGEVFRVYIKVPEAKEYSEEQGGHINVQKLDSLQIFTNTFRIQF